MNALLDSIEHWERLVSLAQAQDTPGLIKEGWHGDSCALCKVHLTNELECGECPVTLHTGLSDCEGTPWRMANAALNEVTSNATPENWAEAIYRTVEELNFLRSLDEYRF